MGRAPSCHCICTGVPGDYGSSSGPSSPPSSSAPSGYSGSQYGIGCTTCIDQVAAAQYTVTFAGITGPCAVYYNLTFMLGVRYSFPCEYYSNTTAFPNSAPGSGELAIGFNVFRTPQCCIPTFSSSRVHMSLISSGGDIRLAVDYQGVGFGGACGGVTVAAQTYGIPGALINCLAPFNLTRLGAASSGGHGNWPATITITPV